MFCPRCGQEQVTEEIKFCSRCGFPLGLVSEILAHGGFLPQLAELYKNKKLLTRRNGLFFSLFWFMFFVLVMTPFFGILDVDKLAGMCAVIGTMGGLFFLITSLTMLENRPGNTEFNNRILPNYKGKNLYQATQSALPPSQSQPAQNYVAPANSWKAPDTGELVRPGSVTEGTTKLLERDEKGKF